MTRLVLISDTHNHNEKISLPKGDILIHAGDLTGRGSLSEIQSALNWIQGTDFKHKIIIAGNHDWLFEKQHSFAKQMCITRNITYLEDELVEVEGLKIYGSPHQPEFCNWAFNLYPDELKRKWDMIPKDVDILITHGPPQGILDKPPMGLRAGCYHLFNKVMEIKPIAHIFGHIHDEYGQKSFNDVLFVNASTCDEMYRPINKPWILEIEDKKVVDIKNDD